MSPRLLILLLLVIGGPAHAWWNCDWRQRIPADVERRGGPPVSNYQVRFDLSAANVPANFTWNRGGADLRVIDQNDQSPLTFFIERWDAVGETAIVWVLVPSIPGGGRTVYLYFDGPSGATSLSTPVTFTEPGLKFHTKRSTADPSNRTQAETAFANGNGNAAGYGCEFLNAYSNLSNSGVFAPPTRDEDIALYAEVFFDVTTAEAGVWQFRYGADFGRGGGLYVDDVVLDEAWNTDLWWNFNWNAGSEILQGSVNLAPGTHSLRILGFEDCCDGGLTAQFRRPGGAWQDLSLTNIPLLSRECPASSEPSVTLGGVESSGCPALSVTRTLQTQSDPTNGTSNPKAIPGDVIVNRIEIRNTGPGPVDAGSFVITEAIDPDTALVVTNFDGATAGPVSFTDGSPPSNLSYTFVSLGNGGDDVAFSNNNGASFSYTPVPDSNGTDAAVTHIRMSPDNAFAGDTGPGTPSAAFRFRTRVK